MENSPSQLCCSTKLLGELSIAPARLPAEMDLDDPLATWYADVFRYERRKCLILFNPATGFAVVAPNVLRKTILQFQSVLADRLHRSMLDDGFSEDAADRCSTPVRNANLARTGNRSSRAQLVQAVNSATFGMFRAVQSDAEAMAIGARLACSHYHLFRNTFPVAHLARLLNETVVPRSGLHEKNRDVCDLYVQVTRIEPRIWRRLVVPSAMSLGSLHEILQCALGWEDYHLHTFEAGELLYEDHRHNMDTEGKDELTITTYDFLKLAQGSAIYRYDFGDNWEVSLRLEARRSDDPGPVPRCEDGARNGPPEDVGGPSGYDEMIRALQHGRGPTFKRYREWLPEGWEPESFSPDSTNVAISLVRRTRMLY